MAEPGLLTLKQQVILKLDVAIKLIGHCSEEDDINL